MEKGKVNIPGALHTDNSLINQPDGTIRFGLNTVNESHEGDRGFRMNEESNYECYEFPERYTPISDVYVGNGETIIFLASSVGDSMIALADRECNFTVLVDDTNQVEKFGFKVSHQISATFRLRRGCERTIYWVDPKPRTFVIEKPEDFKNTNGTWNIDKFSLTKTYSKVPTFSNVEVLESGGNIEPGSINVAVQYVDEDLNPTEWVTTSRTVKIYNDLHSEEFREINGSINSDTDYINFPKTSKALRVDLGNLDDTFLYYRLAFIVSNVGTGQVNEVVYSENIPVSKNFFIYTGDNGVGFGTQEEIALFSEIIEEAEHIEQLENMLILSHTSGKKIDYCALQKYASRIKADCTTKTVVLNNINDPSNPKNPTHEFGGVGYMPGEIYSFGIVWVFADGSTTPVFHIPGKSPDVHPTTIYSPGDSVYPMEANDNACVSTVYSDNDSCGNSSYWGTDSEGIPLTGKPVRHHRFPLRSKLGIPLISSENNPEQTYEFYALRLHITGTLIVPVPCPVETPECGTDVTQSFEVRVTYEVNGETFSFSEVVNPELYANGVDGTYSIDIYQDSQFHSDNTITVTAIEITDPNDNYQDTGTWDNSPYFTAGDGTFTTEIIDYDSTVQGRVHTTEILGIKFSGVEKPSLIDTNGKEIIGYYIVRNERTEFDKTILDSGVVLPCVVNSKYISHGLIAPEVDPSKLSADTYSLIHPEHKFNDKEYTQYDKIIQEGQFKTTSRKYGKINYDDVYDGSSFNSSKQKEGNDDGGGEDGSPTSRGYDGWSLNIISRDNIMEYESRATPIEIDKADIKERFYLDALEYKSINDNANDVYNIAADNKVGIIQLKNGKTFSPTDWTRYVLFYKQNLEPYSNFRVLPYYKDSKDIVLFDNNPTSKETVFNGDSYVTSMRYVNTMFWDNRVAKRKGKTSALKIILGAILIVAGVLLSVFTAGASTALVIAGVAVIGAGATFLSSGIKQSAFNKAYNEEYDKGLRQTALDAFTDMFYNYKNTIPFGFTGNGGTGNDGPSDDSIQWVGDCATDLWFESSINMSLRHHFVEDVTPTFLNSPGLVERGNDSPISTWEFFGINYTNSNSQRYPISSLERHLSRKLLVFNPDRDDNRYYIGVPLGEYYKVNPDFMRKNKEKIYNHLPLEYDCCSDCNEYFPHRNHYSVQSFQEELTDNYRVFLPNNYKDIEGETGKITDVFRIQNNLYIHTEEALWQLPQNLQERITGEVVSFIGTGEFFNIPPRKIVDDANSSAGNVNKWARLKTKYGVLFPSHKEKKWYLFDGQKLNPITQGNENYFREKMFFGMESTYYNANGKDYPYLNNPSNPIGVGYISVYDSKKERFIITKKDRTLKNLPESDYELCNEGDYTSIFTDFSQIIADKEALGFTYEGMEGCRLKFSRTEFETVIETRQITTQIASNSIVIPFFDTTSMTPSVIANISATLDAWFPAFKNSIDGGNNNITFLNPGSWNHWSTENWVQDPAQIVLNNVGTNKDVLILCFVDEANPIFHGAGLSSPMSAPTATYTTSLNNFIANIRPQFASFLAINYPIVRNTATCKEYLQHAIAAIEGENMTVAQTNALVQNPYFTAGEWSTLTTNLQTNPYSGLPALKDYGWLYKENRISLVDGNSSAECPADGISVIPPCEFTSDVATLLQSQTYIETIEVEIQVPVTTIEYVDGQDFIVEHLDESFTMSYSLKDSAWLGWHSYLPSYYFHDQEKFFSWKEDIPTFWKHGMKGNYQTFYGVYHPFIIEFVDNNGAVATKIHEAIQFVTEAKRWFSDEQEYLDIDNVTFNKILAYNSFQITGIKDLQLKDIVEDYMYNQVENSSDAIIMDRNEGTWSINELRDMRVDKTKPMFIRNPEDLQANYFIDKIVNDEVIDFNKDWTEMESFRDKFLVVRLIFDNFDDVRLIMNFITQDSKLSER